MQQSRAVRRKEYALAESLQPKTIMNATIEPSTAHAARQFPPFSLTRLLRTVFDPKPGERVCVLIDLENPADIAGFRFLQNPDLSIQRHAHDVVYQGLRHGTMADLGMEGGEMFAYAPTISGGSHYAPTLYID